MIIGFDAANAISIADPSLSRKHCALRQENGGWTICDMGSVNGTLVNGERVAERPLADSDRITIGRTELLVRQDSELDRNAATLDVTATVTLELEDTLYLYFSEKPSELAALPPGHSAHRWPQFLPGEQRVLFFVRSTELDVAGIYVMSLDDPQHPQRLRGAAGNGLYASNHLLYVQDGELVAEHLDPGTLRLSGQTLPLDLPVSGSSTFYSAFSVSDAGVLVTWAAGDASSELVWFNRAGDRIGTVGGPARYADFQLSPDGQRLAVARVDPGENTSDLWVFDLVRQVLSPLTSTRETEATPVWAASGKRLIFRSNRNGKVHELFERPAYAPAEDTVVHASATASYPTDWSRDETVVLYHEGYPGTGFDLSLFDVRTKKATNLMPVKDNQVQGQFGTAQRVAYMSTEVNEANVFVRRLDGVNGSERISSTAGFDPRWRADGRELYFLDPAGWLIRCAVS